MILSTACLNHIFWGVKTWLFRFLIGGPAENIYYKTIDVLIEISTRFIFQYRSRRVPYVLLILNILLNYYFL